MRLVYLGNPLLPINLTPVEAAESIKKELAKKNWHSAEIKPLILNLVPYFLFNYHYFIEADSNGHKIVKSSVDGALVVDGHDIAVREDLVDIVKYNWSKAAPEVPKIKFEEKWCNIDKKDANEVLKVKTAEYFEVPKANVVISSVRKVFLGFYSTSVVLGKKEVNVMVNTFDKKIIGLKDLSPREKGYVEITKETINDLKSPSNWIKYSVELLGTSTKVVTNGKTEKKDSTEAKAKPSKVNLSLFDSGWILLLIMLLGLLLIIMGYFKIKPF